jgi:cytochrome c
MTKGNEMTRTHLKVLLFTPLLMLLHGCQPDTPAATPATAPVAVPVAGQMAVVEQPKTVVVAATGSKERELAQKSGCFSCHTIEKKLVGPAWNDVSAKYRGQKDVETRLIAKVANGGSGAWGNVPMPPNAPKVPDSDIKVLVRFILSLK